MITYAPMTLMPTITVPVLHSVTHRPVEFEYAMRVWLRDNTEAPYYRGRNNLIQFEDDEEAFMFALVWA